MIYISILIIKKRARKNQEFFQIEFKKSKKCANIKAFFDAKIFDFCCKIIQMRLKIGSKWGVVVLPPRTEYVYLAFAALFP
jgi:hypothetical protein